MSANFVRLANSSFEFKKITYEGYKLTDNRKDLSFMAASLSYLALVPNVDPNSFHVWPLTTGESKVSHGWKYKCDSPVLTIDFDPFYHTRVIVGGETGKFYQWHLNPEVLPEQLAPVTCYEDPYSSAPVQALFHPCAGNVAFLVNAKHISCVNLLTGAVIRECDSEQKILSASLNSDASKILCTYEDQRARILSTSDFSVLYVADIATKMSTGIYMTGVNGDAFAVSFKDSKKRAVNFYKADLSGKYTESSPHKTPACTFGGDSASSVKKWSVIYDPDLNIFLLYTGGETSVSMVHISENCEVLESSTMRMGSGGQVPVKSMVCGPKLSINPYDKELLRIYKAVDSCVELYTYKHPRKASTFDKELYPQTFSHEPALTVDEFVSGKVAQPKKLDLEPLFNKYKNDSGLSRTQSLIVGNSEPLPTSPISLGSQGSLGGGSAGGYVSHAEFKELQSKVDTLSDRLDSLNYKFDALRKGSA